jgi:hypothetical protein
MDALQDTTTAVSQLHEVLQPASRCATYALPCLCPWQHMVYLNLSHPAPC